ncbi:MAG: hypothetical protein M3362_06600 [Acidobacteriota bacterium]|nr:hypothetical protein [Acidobacteriota bacterium]
MNGERTPDQFLKGARLVLLILFFVLCGLIAYLYFRTGKFNFASLVATPVRGGDNA